MLESIRAQRKLARLIREWLELRKLWEQYSAAEEVPGLEELRFLKLKADISSKLPLLETAPAGIGQEATKQRRAMTDLLGTMIALRPERVLTAQEQGEIVRRWHSHFLFLNELKGVALGARSRPRRDRRRELAPRPSVPTGMPVFRDPRRRGGVGHVVRTIFGAAVLLSIAYLIVVAVGIRAQRTWLGIEQYGTTSRQVWEAVPGRVAGFLEPIVASYGTEVTIALLGILLLSVGYWVFIRGR